jgi:magnesium chelatase family protein
LLDRFDLRVMVDRPEVSALLPCTPATAVSESTATVAARVRAARARAGARGVVCNAAIPGPRLDEIAPLDKSASKLLEVRLRQGRLSARGLHRVRRVARTIADLEGRDNCVKSEDVYAALALRADVFPRPEEER